MSDIESIAVLMLAAAAVAALVWFVARLTRGASAKLKALAGLGLIAVLAVPLLLFTFSMQESDRSMAPMAPPPPPEAGQGAPPPVFRDVLPPSVEPGAGESSGGAAPEAAPDTEGAAPPADGISPRPYMAEPPAAETPGAPLEEESKEAAPPEAPGPVTEEPPATAPAAPRSAAPSATAPPEAPSATAPAAPSAPAPAAPSAPPPAASAPSDQWDIVPVFYGTDRAQLADAQRINFGSGRGRRLVLGQALVTVPKAHVVPTIERPWALHIPFTNVAIYEEAEDPNKHFTMKEIRALPEEEFLALVRERLAASNRYKDHAFIFIHGYNTSFDYAIFRTAQIAYDLKFDGVPFSYSWPSGGGIASYTYDRESSGQSEPFLKEFVKLALEKSGAKAVSIIAHSMGNQPALQVLKDLKNAKPEGVVISQIILAAPDVDRDNFENIAAEIQGLAKGVTLYAASNDRALIASRSFYGGIPRAGDVPPSGPLVLSGVDTIDVTAASMDSLGLNHSGYAENNALLNDIGILIQTGERPPKSRVPILEEVTTSKGTYWRYPPTR